MTYNNPTAVLVYIIHCIALWYMLGKAPIDNVWRHLYIPIIPIVYKMNPLQDTCRTLESKEIIARCGLEEPEIKVQ